MRPKEFRKLDIGISDSFVTGKCPASSALEGEVPAYRQAGRGTISNNKSLPGSAAL